MSKVVSGIGNAISGVVKGVVNVVKGVVKGVGDLAKSIASSKLGKAIIIAGAIYFGGAALAGGFGSSAAGGSFLSGMGAGVSSAASTLSSAWGSVMAGNFSQAAGAVGNAWGTAGAAAGQAAGTGAMTVGAGCCTDYGCCTDGNDWSAYRWHINGRHQRRYHPGKRRRNHGRRSTRVWPCRPQPLLLLRAWLLLLRLLLQQALPACLLLPSTARSPQALKWLAA
jgi:hypothetical protein